MSDLLEWALRYAGFGWPVIPIQPGGKAPLTPGGVRDASANQAQVRHWWERWPEANVAIATGAPSGVVVIDVDDPEALARIDGPLPETAKVDTPNGMHLYYQCPADGLPNSVSRLADKVDTRGDGGYVLMPPSVNGDPVPAAYRWADKRKPAPLPAWVPEALARPRAEPEPDEGDGSTTAYGRAVLNGELSRLVQAREGTRNDTLFQASVRVFELVKADQIDRTLARDSLVRAARGCGLDGDEVRKTLESAWDRAEARPPGDSDDGDERPLPDDRIEPHGRFLTLADLRQMEPPKWLVPHVLPEGFTALYGRRGGGKTFVALDIALTMASHGHTVVYCVGEGASGLQQRADAWQLAHPGMDPGDRFLVRAHGDFPRLVREQSVAQLMEGMRFLERERRTPTLLVVDTWKRALAGTSVSSDEVTSQAIDVLDTLRDRWGTSSLVIHHPRRPSKDDPNPPEAGSGTLGDNADCVWKLWTPGDDDQGERRLFNEKLKEWPEQSPLSFSLSPQGDSLVVAPSVSDLMD